MISKSRARLLRRLAARRMREREGLALAEGPRVVREALRSPARVLWIVIGAEYAGSEPGRGVLADCRNRGVEVELLPDREVTEFASTESPQPVIACVSTPFAVRLPLSHGRYLMPLGVQIPGNLGTLIRSAWAFGLDGLVVPGGTVDPWNPKVVRASAGAVFHVPQIAPPDPAADMPGDAMAGVNLLCADPGGVPADEIAEVGARDWVLVVGNETGGLPAHIVRRARAVSIPMRPGVDSLNVAVAGSILMHLLTRHTA
ncbi:MAG: RNA methyltransferase [Gemmatimonadota bacterium]|nr:RNA methyltransferase [Gemmatimonadota bacterium]